MSGRAHRLVFWLGVAALCAAHVGVRVLDQGAEDSVATPLLGAWLPVDMAFHLGWIVVAGLWVLYMCGPVWRDDAARLDAADAASEVPRRGEPG